MERSKNDVAGVCQTSASVVNDEDRQLPGCRRPTGLTITVEKIDRMLADVQTQIELFRQRQTNLRLVREELARMEAMWRNE